MSHASIHPNHIPVLILQLESQGWALNYTLWYASPFKINVAHSGKGCHRKWCLKEASSQVWGSGLTSFVLGWLHTIKGGSNLAYTEVISLMCLGRHYGCRLLTVAINILLTLWWEKTHAVLFLSSVRASILSKDRIQVWHRYHQRRRGCCPYYSRN